MNGTRVIYSQAAQGILPLPGLVLCPVFCALIYRYVRKRFVGGERLKSRAYLFYRMMCAIFLGQFVCHTFFKGTVYSTFRAEILAMFVLLGWFTAETLEALARVCGPNKYTNGPRDQDIEDDIVLNKDTMEDEDYIVMNGMGTAESGHKLNAVHDSSYDARKRRWILFSVMVTFMFVNVVDGLFLVYRNPQSPGSVAAIVIFFYVNKMAQTVAVCGAMVHAKIHTIAGMRKRVALWGGLSFVWCASVFLSTVPILASSQLADVAAIVTNPALAALFSYAAGVVLWDSQYFRAQKLRKIDTKDTLVALGVLFVFLSQSAVSALFL